MDKHAGLREGVGVFLFHTAESARSVAPMFPAFSLILFLDLHQGARIQLEAYWWR
jgi:hypothetical protein